MENKFIPPNWHHPKNIFAERYLPCEHVALFVRNQELLGRCRGKRAFRKRFASSDLAHIV